MMQAREENLQSQPGGRDCHRVRWKQWDILSPCRTHPGRGELGELTPECSVLGV